MISYIALSFGDSILEIFDRLLIKNVAVYVHNSRNLNIGKFGNMEIWKCGNVGMWPESLQQICNLLVIFCQRIANPLEQIRAN